MPAAKKRRTGGKTKGTGTVTDDDLKRLLNRDVWSGWVEVESEPAFFNVMIRELGVQGAKFQEIFNIQDDMEFVSLPEPVHALIFLFEYQGTEVFQPETECPSHVWFANQVPEFACASVAILNIINNVAEIELGSHLQQFKDVTADKTPLERGYAIDKFDFLRKVHNSFARELDILQSTMVIKEKHEKQIAKQKAEEKYKAQEARKAAKNTAADVETGVRRSGRKRKERLQMDDSATENEETDEAGNHYVAYVPIDGQVWMMDGMAGFPRLVGSVKDDEGWLVLARQSIIEKMTEYEASQHSFNLMAMVHDAHDAAQRRLQPSPTVSGRDGPRASIPELLAKVEDMKPLSTPFVVGANNEELDTARGGQSPTANGTTKHAATMPATTDHEKLVTLVGSGCVTSVIEGKDAGPVVIDGHPSSGLVSAVADKVQYEQVTAGDLKTTSNLNDTIEVETPLQPVEHGVQDDSMGLASTTNNEPLSSTEILRLEQTIAAEAEQRASDEQKATLRRHDLKPFFTAWVQALQEGDFWDPLLVVAKDQTK